MAQGGFARDAHRAALARIRKEQEELNRSREIITQDVMKGVLGDLRNRSSAEITKHVKRIEETLVLKQDKTVGEFIRISHDRNRLLKFLLWINFTSWITLSFVLGYFL